MAHQPLQGEFVGELNISLFFETLVKLIGEQCDAEIKIVGIRKREATETGNNLFESAKDTA